jgi:hypothetical protein
VHLQKTTNAEETVEAKEALELFASSHGVQILHDHADNGRFAENRFRKAVIERPQTLSFCGVNAHFQNGMAERRIRELQDHALTMLIHASKRWPSAIDPHLWPYALRKANEALNSTPNMKKKQIPIELFSMSKVSFNPKDCYQFGTPVYVLYNGMAAGKKLNKVVRADQSGSLLGKVLAACKDRRPRSVSHDKYHLSAISRQV